MSEIILQSKLNVMHKKITISVINEEVLISPLEKWSL